MYGLRLWDVYAAATLAGLAGSVFNDHPGYSSGAASVAAKTADKLLALRAEHDSGPLGLGEEVCPGPHAGPMPAPAEIIANGLEEVAAAIADAAARAERL